MIIKDGFQLQIFVRGYEMSDWENFEERHEFTGRWLVNKIEGDLYGHTFFEVKEKGKIFKFIPISCKRWVSADSFRFIEVTMGDCKG